MVLLYVVPWPQVFTPIPVPFRGLLAAFLPEILPLVFIPTPVSFQAVARTDCSGCLGHLHPTRSHIQVDYFSVLPAFADFPLLLLHLLLQKVCVRDLVSPVLCCC